MAKSDTSERYYKPSRDLAKREIHRLITTEGLTNSQLCDRLQIPRRSLQRYLNEIFTEDNQMLMNPTREDVLTYVTIFKEQLLTQRQQILTDIANNPKIDGQTRLEAHEQAADLAYTAFRLNVNTPAFVLRHSGQVTLENTNRALNLKGAINTAELGQNPFNR
jgi:hypothetical protein